MRLLILHQYFRRPEEGGAIRSFHLLKGFVSRGFEVTVITAHNKSFKEVIDVEGAKVIYLPVNYDNTFSFPRRLISFTIFFFRSYLELRRNPTDLVYSISTPLTVGLLAFLNKRIHKTKYVFEVGDLWPALPEQMGIIKSRLLISLAYKFEKLIVRNASLIVSMSPDITNYYRALEKNVESIEVPNFSDMAFFNEKRHAQSKFSQEIKELSDKIVCVYTGTFGFANDIQQILSLALLAKKHEFNFHFLLIGEGAQRESIYRASKNIPNVTLLPFSNKEDTFAILKSSDFSFVCYAQYPLLGSGSPNKLFDSLAMGKIPIINVKGWMSTLFERENCGLYWDMKESEKLLKEMMEIHSNRAKYNEISLNGKSVASENFDLEKNLDRLGSKIKSLKLE